MFLNAVKRIHSFKFSCLHCMSSIPAHPKCDASYRIWRNQSVKWFVKYTALDILVVLFTLFLPSILIFWQLFCPEYNDHSLVYNSGKFCFTKQNSNKDPGSARDKTIDYVIKFAKWRANHKNIKTWRSRNKAKHYCWGFCFVTCTQLQLGINSVFQY